MSKFFRIFTVNVFFTIKQCVQKANGVGPVSGSTLPRPNLRMIMVMSVFLCPRA